MARAKTLQDAARCTFTAVIEADEEDGGFVVTFPAIPNLATQGETFEEAHQMAEDYLRGYLEVLRETGRPLPKPSEIPPNSRHDHRAHDPDGMSRPLPALRPRQVIRALERAGFVLIRIKGSHHYFEHPERPATDPMT